MEDDWGEKRGKGEIRDPAVKEENEWGEGIEVEGLLQRRKRGGVQD